MPSKPSPRVRAIFDAIRDDGATDWPDEDVTDFVARIEGNLRSYGYRIVSTKRAEQEARAQGAREERERLRGIVKEAIATHFEAGRHGMSLAACGEAVVVAVFGPEGDPNGE